VALLVFFFAPPPMSALDAMSPVAPSSSDANVMAAMLQARYGASASALADLPAQAWTPVLEAMLAHRSVRKHRPDPVTDAQLCSVIAAAQSAATSSNLQVWSVVAVRDAATKAALAECAGGQAHVAQAPLVLMWLVDLARLAAVAEQLGLPHAALDSMEMFLVGAIDATLAAQNAMLAAEALGLAGCYIGGMRNQPEKVAALLGLPPKVFAVFGMTLGVEDPSPAPAAVKPRLPQSVVLHTERYTPAAEQAEGVEAYNAAMADFYASQQMAVRGTWAVHSSRRVADDAALTGRHRLAEALRGMGFGLK
jgi:nitroreductase